MSQCAYNSVVVRGNICEIQYLPWVYANFVHLLGAGEAFLIPAAVLDWVDRVGGCSRYIILMYQMLPWFLLDEQRRKIFLYLEKVERIEDILERNLQVFLRILAKTGD
jgi:hypothetical protein